MLKPRSIYNYISRFFSTVPLSLGATTLFIISMQINSTLGPLELLHSYDSSQGITIINTNVDTQSVNTPEFQSFSANIDGGKGLSLPSENLEDFEIQLGVASFQEKQYMNLFQTSDEGSGIRIEQVFVESGKVVFYVFYRTFDNSERFVVSKPFEREKLRTLKLKKTFDNDLILWVNQTRVLQTRIAKQDIRFDNFVFGTGLSESRPFFGTLTLEGLKLQISRKKPLIPPLSLLFIPLSFLLLRSWKHIRKFIAVNFSGPASYTRILDPLLLILLILITLGIHSRKPFAAFFGDDLFAMQLRGSSPSTLITEGIGSIYRPLGAIAMLFRFQLSGESIELWRIGNFGLISLFCILIYFIFRRMLSLNPFFAILCSFAITLSGGFFSQMTWWATPGNDGLLKSISYCLVVITALNVINHPESLSAWREMISMISLSVLVSEIMTPLIILPLLLCLVYLKTSRMNQSTRQKVLISSSHGLSNPYLIKMIFRNTALQVFIFSAAYFFTKTQIASVAPATAAASAANFEFNSFDPLLPLTNFITYFLAHFGVVVGQFKDFGVVAPNGMDGLIFFSDSPNWAKVFFSITCAISVLSLFTLLLNRKNQIMKLMLLSLYCLTMIPPLLVPNYLQSRWGFLGLVCLVALLSIGLSSNRSKDYSRITTTLCLLSVVFISLSGLLIVRLNFLPGLVL